VIRTEPLPDGTIEAIADVVVGLDTKRVRVPLGRFAGEIDPGGLRNIPVVVLTAASLEPVVRAGAERAGSASVTLVRVGSGWLGARLIEAAGTAEVLTVVSPVDAAGDTLVVARVLGGRPLPVVPLDDREAGAIVFGRCWVDVDVAIPSVDGALREDVRSVAAELGLFTTHHVVEVDPRAALGERDVTVSTLQELAAAATGVLAGRIASANRRWR
jgi:hypothetical protein